VGIRIVIPVLPGLLIQLAVGRRRGMSLDIPAKPEPFLPSRPTRTSSDSLMQSPIRTTPGSRWASCSATWSGGTMQSPSRKISCSPEAGRNRFVAALGSGKKPVVWVRGEQDGEFSPLAKLLRNGGRFQSREPSSRNDHFHLPPPLLADPGATPATSADSAGVQRYTG